MKRLKPNCNTNPWKSHSVRVHQVVQEGPGVATYSVVFTDPEVEKAYRFMPGQFNMLYVPGVGESAISISSDPSTPHLLRHTIRAVGGVTKAIAAAGRGASIGLRGPFGSSWPIDACLSDAVSPREIIFVAGGIGLAPLRSAICTLSKFRRQLGNITILVGARSPQDLLFQGEYSHWRQQGMNVQTTVDRPTDDWQGNIGVVTTLLNRLAISRPKDVMLMTCGPEVMMRYVVQSSLQRGLSPENIWLSLERNMNCAVGLCGHCQLGPEFLCKDGPVLPYPRVSHWLKVQAF